MLFKGIMMSLSSRHWLSLLCSVKRILGSTISPFIHLHSFRKLETARQPREHNCVAMVWQSKVRFWPVVGIHFVRPPLAVLVHPYMAIVTHHHSTSTRQHINTPHTNTANTLTSRLVNSFTTRDMQSLNTSTDHHTFAIMTTPTHQHINTINISEHSFQSVFSGGDCWSESLCFFLAFCSPSSVKRFCTVAIVNYFEVLSYQMRHIRTEITGKNGITHFA
jgi:hypothetical protein